MKSGTSKYGFLVFIETSARHREVGTDLARAKLRPRRGEESDREEVIRNEVRAKSLASLC